MNKGIGKIAKVSLRNLKVAYIVTGIAMLTTLIQTLVYIILAVSTGNSYDTSGLSLGCYLWMIPLWAAIEIPLEHFRRIVNLGGKRINFLLGSLAVYVIMALVGAFTNTVIYYTVDRFIQTSGFFREALFGGVMNLAEIFGWTGNGPVVAFLRQFAFLFLVTTIVHTLVSIQDRWYGWATDIMIAAIVSIFTPIAALRPVLTGFFHLIIFQPNALLQIIVCLVIGLAVYSLNKPIFARKIV